MPRNFDELHTDDRTFTIGGQEFKWRYLHWREFAGSIDEEQAARAEARKNGTEPAKDEAEEDEGDTLVESFEKVIGRILMYLEPGDHARFLEATEDEDKPVTIVQLNELANWLLEVQTDRPTQAPQISSPGPGLVAASSRAS